MDTIVHCLYNSSCLLPSNYKQGDATNICWMYKKAAIVHSSFSENRNMSLRQDLSFKGRTSLVEDQVTGRKTELLLENAKVEDEGPFQFVIGCRNDGYQSTNVVQVNAPVQRVDIIRAGNIFTCSSEGVYPKPELTWSANPKFKVNPQPNTTVQQTEGKLYNISSSLKLPDVDEDLLVSCTVSTRLNEWTSTWRKPIVTNGWAEISCSHMNTSSGGFSLVWRFNDTDIMTWNRTDGQHVSAQWKKHVLAEMGSDVLHLRNLSSDLCGTYRCELSSANETRATHTQLTLNTGGSKIVVGGVIGIIIIVILVIAIAVFVYLVYHYRCQRKNVREANSHEMEPMKHRLA
ncbi:butyrophilin-like protein 2 isoform X2 [Gouania willdenowi]|uniref:butyrophilin-like protein 2 isoform X2 n=1 Tax=Gouania willdenowi TaxID=441366 RepID=UPI0010548F09|nr:butyrophilin-like protein 2 isoform X2 [Gouania willdenowi]